MSTRLSRIDTISSGDLFTMASGDNGDYRLASLTTVLNWIKLAFASPDPVEQIVVPTNGFTQVVRQDGTSTWLILRPAGTLATGTITLPLNTLATDGQLVIVNSTAAITTFTVGANGATAVYGDPATMAAEATFTLKFNSTTNSWYRIA